MVLVPLNSRLAAPELKYILNDAGAKALLVSDAFFPILEGLRDSLSTVEHVLAYGKGPFPGKALDYEAHSEIGTARKRLCDGRSRRHLRKSITPAAPPASRKACASPTGT